ncbi:hypothetical protein M885DRAFT_437600, partial [Pelagophyceae sp. CCMP2097]
YWYNAASGAAQYETPAEMEYAGQYDASQYGDETQGGYETQGYETRGYETQGDETQGDETQGYDYADDAPAPQLEAEWAQYQDEDGNWYNHNRSTGESSYDDVG